MSFDTGSVTGELPYVFLWTQQMMVKVILKIGDLQVIWILIGSAPPWLRPLAA